MLSMNTLVLISQSWPKCTYEIIIYAELCRNAEVVNIEIRQISFFLHIVLWYIRTKQTDLLNLFQGRALSRAKSRRNIGFEQVLESLNEKGISIRVASPKLVMEEAPESYKNVTDVVNTCKYIMYVCTVFIQFMYYDSFYVETQLRMC